MEQKKTIAAKVTETPGAKDKKARNWAARWCITTVAAAIAFTIISAFDEPTPIGHEAAIPGIGLMLNASAFLTFGSLAIQFLRAAAVSWQLGGSGWIYRALSAAPSALPTAATMSGSLIVAPTAFRCIFSAAC